jgi:hypothetical protein
MARFYLLALAAIAVLALIPYVEAQSGSWSPFLTLVAIVGIFAILIGVLPRRHFVQPGTSGDRR